MSIPEIALLYLLMVIAGLSLETIAVRAHYYLTKTHYKEHHFTFGKYILVLIMPLMASFYVIGKVPHLLNVFIVFAFVGPFLEWLLGFSYYKIVGQRLWTYHRYSITHYTSFLTIPFWGLAGVLFWLLSQLFG